MSGDRLRIGQFITQYPYESQFEKEHNYFCSGAERVAQRVSEVLVEKGHEVHVFTSSSGRHYEQSVQNGVIVHRSPSITRINTTQIAPTMVVDHVGEEFDIVHAHNSTPPGTIAAYLHSVLTGTPMIVTHHGGEQYESHGSFLRRSGLYLYTQLLIEPLFSHARRVVTPSEGYIVESESLSSDAVNVSTIPNGIDVDNTRSKKSSEEAKVAVGLDPDEFTVLYLGSHHPRKGVDVLIRAFADALETAGQGALVLAGSGDMTDRLKDEVRRYGIEEHVSFPGYVSESVKSTYLTAADLFVLPSTTPGAEVFPLVLLEAAATGTPVIASDFPTIRSAIDDYDIGVLVKPGDESALANALTELYANDKLQDYGRNAREMANEHRWSSIVDEYLTLYQRVVE